MSVPMVLQQYWQLIRALWFPLRFVRWLAVAEVGLLTIGGLVLWWENQAVVLIVAIGIGLVLSITVSIMVPGQVLAFVSSKQLSWIPGLRIKVCILLMCLCLLLALAGSYWLITMNKGAQGFTSMFSVALLFLSFVSVLMVVSRVYLGFFQVFIFPLIWFSSIAAEHFFRVELLACWGLIAIVWIGFYFWWRQWQPQKYLVNVMTLPQAKMKELQEQQQGLGRPLSHYLSSTPGSLPGTLLLAASDGFNTYIKREIGYLLLIALTVALMLFLMRQIPINVLQHLTLVLIVVYFLSRGFQLQLNIYRNLYRLWPVLGGTRRAVLYYVERQFIVQMAVMFFPVMVIGVLLNNFFGSAGISIVVLLFSGLISALLLVQLFYVSLVIYIKSAASVAWLNWLSSILTVCFMLLITYLDLLWGNNVRQSSSDYWLFCGVLVLMVLAARLWALRSWRYINFTRVKI
jgi:hypothetical protein